MEPTVSQKGCCSTELEHNRVHNGVNVIVVSNRVARAKTDEPVAGGLAAALIPMVKEFGRDLGRIKRPRQ